MRPLLVLLFLVKAILPVSSLALNVTAGPYPKFPDILQCNTVYGENLTPQACFEALETMPDGSGFQKFISHKTYAGQDALVVPVLYRNSDVEHPCVITVDLAGRSTTDISVNIRKATLRQLVNQLNTSCIVENSGSGGFITYKLQDTIFGVSDYKPVSGGYNAPLFLTVQVSPQPSRIKPGDVDPFVNAAIQKGLDDEIPTKTRKSSVNKIIVLINALKQTYERMTPGGNQAWWDSRHVTNSIPENVDYNCLGGQGLPTPRARDCEDASFRFSGTGNVVIRPDKSLSYQVGNCMIEVRTHQPHACPGAVGLGGVATAQPFAAANSTILQSRQSSANHSDNNLSAGPPLPPTFEIEVMYADPVPIVPGCGPTLEAFNNTDGCIAYVPVMTNGTATDASLTISNDSGAAVSLSPAAVA